MGVYLGLGSNLGDRHANLRQALRLLEQVARVDAVSALYESLPQPPAPPPNYYNAACRVVTELRPLELLREVKRIEAEMGRTDGPRWSPRPIDIDIELYDNEIVETDELVIPHPRLLERNFVLQPLLDIDLALVHPVTGERLSEVLARLGYGGLMRLEDSGWAVAQ
jgi:2-amino-4-hydroxy-6-hydroxymethyldihydropteridine diphosphokinase